MILSSLATFAALSLGAAAFAQGTQKPPYWVSVNKDTARMRTGPNDEFPIKWVYRRKNLPLKVVAVHELWRKVEDPDGEQGWMHVRLLTPDRSAIVRGAVAPMRTAPREDAPLAWRAEPGVVGRISDCTRGWCSFDVAGRTGYIRADAIWGEEKP